MKMIYYIILIILFSGCKNKRQIICSKDKNQCITIITKKDVNIRYVIDGKHYSVPDTNYIKLNLDKIPSLGDGIWGCWDKRNKGWDITVEKASIMENKLDTLKFTFHTRLPKNDKDIQRETKYLGENCFIFDFLNNEVEGNGVLK